VAGRLDPSAFFVEASADAVGAEDSFGDGDDMVGVLDDELGGEAQIFAALLEQAGGACVTIDGTEIGQTVLLADEFGVAPVEEMFFDADAIGMVADDAFAGVAIVRGEGGIVVFHFFSVLVGVLVVVLGDFVGDRRDFLVGLRRTECIARRRARRSLRAYGCTVVGSVGRGLAAAFRAAGAFGFLGAARFAFGGVVGIFFERKGGGSGYLVCWRLWWIAGREGRDGFDNGRDLGCDFGLDFGGVRGSRRLRCG